MFPELRDEDAARRQRRGADKHSACAVVNPVIVWAAADPIMLAAIKWDGLSCQSGNLSTDVGYELTQIAHTHTNTHRLPAPAVQSVLSHTHRIINACRPIYTRKHTHTAGLSGSASLLRCLVTLCQLWRVDPWTWLMQLKDSCAEGLKVDVRREDTHWIHRHTHQYFIVLRVSREFSSSYDLIVWAPFTSPPSRPSFPKPAHRHVSTIKPQADGRLFDVKRGQTTRLPIMADTFIFICTLQW